MQQTATTQTIITEEYAVEIEKTGRCMGMEIFGGRFSLHILPNHGAGAREPFFQRHFAHALF